MGTAAPAGFWPVSFIEVLARLWRKVQEKGTGAGSGRRRKVWPRGRPAPNSDHFLLPARSPAWPDTSPTVAFNLAVTWGAPQSPWPGGSPEDLVLFEAPSQS